MRSIDRDFQMRIATRAKDHRLPAALIHRSIADQPDVSGDQVAVGFKDLAQMGRAGLLLTLPDKTNVGMQRDLRRPQCIERGKLRDDRRLIVRGRTRVEPLLAVYSAQHRSEWRAALPFRWGHRLAVVVRIEDD